MNTQKVRSKWTSPSVMCENFVVGHKRKHLEVLWSASLWRYSGNIHHTSHQIQMYCNPDNVWFSPSVTVMSSLQRRRLKAPNKLSVARRVLDCENKPFPSCMQTAAARCHETCSWILAQTCRRPKWINDHQSTRPHWSSSTQTPNRAEDSVLHVCLPTKQFSMGAYS